ncbi:ABC transporter substrate-binding protein [Flavobacterium sp. 7A]|uniref:ABC transporter substrate-binding protein n=1 Tax=Flavobacterium sp. 7A TaxID=2940571 RepID=UPI002227838F|nr:ABC transporter substrate-binding protein [Flavobacterium sp. 7A]MCW2119331.1 urea transport system substrate-binding protein [Flavobacterium sp. 7A]
MMPIYPKQVTYTVFAFISLTVIATLFIVIKKNVADPSPNTIKIGLLYAKTGDWAISQKSVHDAMAMAVEEINNDGGLLGKQIEIAAINNESDDRFYNTNVSELFNKENVVTLFCFVPKIIINHNRTKNESSDGLVFDLADYNAKERNTTTIKLGSSPNQLLYPGINYLFKNKNSLYTNYIILGTNDSYSLEANKLIKKYLSQKKVPYANIHPILLTPQKDNISEVIVNVKKIVSNGKTCILNTMKGNTNIVFFKEFTNQGLSSLNCPIMSFTISEDELMKMSAEFNIGHYFCRNYFQSVDAENNIRFVSDFKLYSAINELPDGIDRVTGEEISKIYNGVFLWKKAVELALTFEPNAVKAKLAGLVFNSPAGIIKINKRTLSLEKPAIVAESTIDGQMMVLWESKQLILPF